MTFFMIQKSHKRHIDTFIKNTMEYLLTIYFILWIIINLYLKKLFRNSLKKDNPYREVKFLVTFSLILFIISFISLMIFKYPFGIIGIFLLIQSAVSYSFGRSLIKKKKMI